MRALWLLLAIVVLTLPATAWAEQRVHVVGAGHTLGKIAQRYRITIDELCQANGISRRDRIKPGQKLVIPSKDAPPAAAQRAVAAEPSAPESPVTKDGITRMGSDGLSSIELPGGGLAYFYEPIGAGRLSMRPIFMFMHGRGGYPVRDCRRWAPVVRRLGWLVCPAGPGARGDGRGWNNNWVIGQRTANAAVAAMRAKFGRRVQLYGNTLMGFSEGAYVAMNVGVRDPRTFNRWLILAGNTTYWGGPGLEELPRASARVRRVYLITGEQDGVIEGTRSLREWLDRHKIDSRISTPADLGHELALERKEAMYRAALVWLEKGTPAQPRGKRTASRSAAAARQR